MQILLSAGFCACASRSKWILKVIMPVAIQKTFEALLAGEPSQLNGRVQYNRVSRSAATFKSGLDAPVHRWFRLTPSFGPDLVRQMLAELNTRKDELVLDPFAGASTTLIEAQLLGYSASGFEINPFLHFVGETSLDWGVDVEVVARVFEQVARIYQRERPNVCFDNLNAHGLSIPLIHNPTRWW
ncbi:MAG: DNA methyltransferase [Limisphaerales bacterium]